MKKLNRPPIYVTESILPDISNLEQHLKEIWESKILTNVGTKHKLLESKLKEYLQCSEITLFNNGTIALIAAFKALRLQGEVITTPFTFPATAQALTWAGLTPVFCDIRENDYTMDPDKIINCITSKTCAIVPVHIFGQPCQVKEIEVIAKKYGLRVIYDAAHSFGTKVNNIPIGNFGDISMFSFHATKMFHTVEGGCLTFAEPLLKSRIDALKNFGLDTETGLVAMLGLNGKLSEVHAAIGLEVLELVNKEIQDRKNFFHMYLNELKNIDGIKLPFLDESVTYNYQYFGIQINKEKFKFTRDDVSKQLASYDIYTKKYFEPCNNFPDYKHFPTSQQVPITNKVASETLVLPLHGRLREEDIIFICNTIKTMR